jgi:malonyl CoA-acyl carrier protein transacylase
MKLLSIAVACVILLGVVRADEQEVLAGKLATLSYFEHLVKQAERAQHGEWMAKQLESAKHAEWIAQQAQQALYAEWLETQATQATSAMNIATLPQYYSIVASDADVYGTLLGSSVTPYTPAYFAKEAVREATKRGEDTTEYREALRRIVERMERKK